MGVNILIIEDDSRVSRYISQVAKRLGLVCLAAGKKSDIAAIYKNAMPDIILLDPKPREEQCAKVLRILGELHTDVPIVLADTTPEELARLEELGRSLGLHMQGFLPGVFDTEALRGELASVFNIH